MLKITDIKTIHCGSLSENAYLVCPPGRDDAFIVDPGDGLHPLMLALQASKRKLAGILLTHGHFDHILAAQPLHELHDAPVYIHSLDAEMLDNPNKSSYMEGICQLQPPEDLERVHYGSTLEICGLKLEIIHTPGHSKGSVCIYDPESRIMFSGDTIFRAGYGRSDLYGGNNLELIRSLKSLLTTLPGETVVLSGHGDETTIALEKRRYGL